MEWAIVMHDEIMDDTKAYIIPFRCGQMVYYVHKKKWHKRNSKWIIEKCFVDGVWAGGVYGITLDNGEQIAFCYFDQLFTEREEAIEFCAKMNKYTKVKIYGDN